MAALCFSTPASQENSLLCKVILSSEIDHSVSVLLLSIYVLSLPHIHQIQSAVATVNETVDATGMLRSGDHAGLQFFGLGLGLILTVTGLGLGLGLMKSWSRSHTFWSRGLKSIICSSNVMTSDCVPCSVNTRIWSL